MPIDVARLVTGKLPELRAVLNRFPLAVAAAVALTLYHLFELQSGSEPEDYAWRLRVSSGLSLAFLWALGATLYAEERQFPAASAIGIGLVGWAVFGFLFLAWQAVDADWWLLAAAACLGLSVAPYLTRAPRNGETWQFNHHLWIGAVVATVAMCLFAGGVSIIIETLRYLFGLNIPYRVHEKVWIVAGCLIAPVYWLSVVPRDFAVKVQEGEQTEFTSRSVAALVRFILAPLLLVYGAILHAYAVKILFDQSLPRNRIGWLVLSFGVAVAMTALAAYPTRTAGGRIVQLFWRIWPWMLAVPLVMLAVAIGQRIGQYGLTEARYMVVLAGVWLASLVFSQGLSGAGRDLRLITGVLAALLALAAIGPWGMSGWPVRNQVSTLVRLLSAAGVVRDGRVVATARLESPFSAAERARLHGIVDYLSERNRLDALRPLFAGSPNDPFAGQPRVTRANSAAILAGIRERLALGPRPSRDGGARSLVSFSAQGAGIVLLAGGGRAVGPLALSFPAPAGEGSVEIAAGGNRILFRIEEGSRLRLAMSEIDRPQVFDLKPLLAREGPLRSAPSAGQTPLRLPPVDLRAEGDGPPATLIVQTVNAAETDTGSLRVTYLNAWLMLPPGN